MDISLRDFEGGIKRNDNFFRVEPKLDLALGLLFIGRRMDDIFIDALGGDAPVSAADARGVGLFRVGGSSDVTDVFDGVRALIDKRHHALAVVILSLNVEDEILEKGSAFELLVMFFRQ